MSEQPTDDCVELGFIEETPAWKLRSKFFPSKVGGFPAWLALKGLPICEHLSCSRCKKPLVFLCQIYAPFNDNKNCFHRAVFVFICRDPGCSQENDAKNIRVFRCQLSRINEFYSKEPPPETENDSTVPSASTLNLLCRVCGCLSSKVCSSCKLSRYCCKEHQSLDWKCGHRDECKHPESIDPLHGKGSFSFLFPEFEIDLEPEVLDEKQHKSEEEISAEYDELLKSAQISQDHDDDEENLIEMSAKETDKVFKKFRTRIQRYPTQVLRYDRGQEPLWVSSDHRPKEIPCCELCGGKRQFEFQIMPQLLSYLKVDSPGLSIDWGTILVFTCINSCQTDEVYVEEIAFKQDYSPVNI